ncbi:MAG: hypothetical protein LQ337_007189, partial [Flavoplaca oasis]
MDANGQIKLSSPARVGQDTFVVSSKLRNVRTSQRVALLIIFGRLQPDDALVLFSWIALLLNAILWHIGQDALYENIAVSSGQLYPPPPDFSRRTEKYLRRSVAVIIFFFTGLWSIKLAFLLFFKRLGQNVRHQDKVWWVVLSITIATYVACVGTIDYRCLASSFSYIQIIFVPVNLLRKVRLSVRKKLALGGLFSITVIIMVFAIIRVVVVSSYSHQLDQTWLYLWSGVEQAVSIVVACLASFPALFKSSEREKHRNQEPGWLRRMFSKNITGIKSTITVYNPLVKRSKRGSDEYSDHLSNPAPPRKHNEIYLETQMLRSVDGKGKFLQS